MCGRVFQCRDQETNSGRRRTQGQTKADTVSINCSSVTNTWAQADNMTSIRLLELLLPLLLHRVSGEETGAVFGAESTTMDMGNCFGVDYIVVYRCAPEGDQLLGNSAANNTAITPPADLQSRIRVHKEEYLIGFQISHLTHKDSGVYRVECWKNQTLDSQQKQELFVCNEETSPEEIHVKEENGGAEIQCNSRYIGLEGTSVRWYYESYPSYKPTLLLDSSVSLVPLVEELQSVVEVRDHGTLLLLKNSQLKKNLHFICLVSKGENCLSFQNVEPSDGSDSRYIFALDGDKVVLPCPSEGNDQHWESPFGRVDGDSEKMHVSFGDKSEDFSLVIPAFSDELSGDYSCISSLLELQYFLVNCYQKESQEKVAVEGGNALLECHADRDDIQRVQWHRREPGSGKNKLIYDSRDATVHIPGDLRGRLSLSENGSLFNIFHLEARDQGVYWCVVLEDNFLDEYTDDTEDADSEEQIEDDQYFDDDTFKCIFKQETDLRVEIRPTIKTVVVERSPKSAPEADPSTGSNVAAYAVGAGLAVLLLVVGGIVAVIVIKRKAEVTANRELTIRVDPGCTEALAPQ